MFLSLSIFFCFLFYYFFFYTDKHYWPLWNFDVFLLLSQMEMGFSCFLSLLVSALIMLGWNGWRSCVRRFLDIIGRTRTPHRLQRWYPGIPLSCTKTSINHRLKSVKGRPSDNRNGCFNPICYSFYKKTTPPKKTQPNKQTKQPRSQQPTTKAYLQILGEMRNASRKCCGK